MNYTQTEFYKKNQNLRHDLKEKLQFVNRLDGAKESIEEIVQHWNNELHTVELILEHLENLERRQHDEPQEH